MCTSRLARLRVPDCATAGVSAETTLLLPEKLALFAHFGLDFRLVFAARGAAHYLATVVAQQAAPGRAGRENMDGDAAPAHRLQEPGRPQAVLCYAEGAGGRWEAFCLTFDLAVQGESFEDVYRKLNEQIALYAEGVAAMAPQDRKRLWNRRAPLGARARFAWKILRAAMAGRDGKSRHEYSLPMDCLPLAA